MSHITYIFFLCNFWSAIFLLHMILRATIGRRCVCRFFLFLELFPLMFTKYLFTFFPFSKARWQLNMRWRSSLNLWLMSLFGSSYDLLVILSLNLHINFGFGWLGSLEAFGCSLSPPSPLSLFISLDSFLSLCCNIVFCLCLFVILYRCMELSSVWWSS